MTDKDKLFMAEVQKSRLEIIDVLDDLIDKAYNELPHDEYKSLEVARGYIRTRYDLQDIQTFIMNFAADHKMDDMTGELPYEE